MNLLFLFSFFKNYFISLRFICNACLDVDVEPQSLTDYLERNQLTGPNYVDWKRNLDIVLTVQDYKFVLNEPDDVLPEPHETTGAHARWKKANDIAKCYSMASISNVLQHQYEGFKNAGEIINGLKEMFSEHSRSAKAEATRKLMNTKMQ
ncbi:uncharacterized protein LOC113294935 [Papaver somniferum]|uniref:uncharacterized protein LOC113294935 n=1 Tax=Papaver somniferum TaxID=3469 RepID=UPI000E7044CC|nr:uncharacterized protein LOC113294935 [Papaver somniferum]